MKQLNLIKKNEKVEEKKEIDNFIKQNENYIEEKGLLNFVQFLKDY